MIAELIIAGLTLDLFNDDGTVNDRSQLKEIVREYYKIVDDDELNRRTRDLEYEMKEVKTRHKREDARFRKSCKYQYNV